MHRYLSILLLLCCIPFSASAQPEQRYQRFQYHKYKWQAFHTTAFHLYIPKGYDSLCDYTSRELPIAIKRIRHEMGATSVKAPHIIIYPSPAQAYETNIGLYEQEQYAFPTLLSKSNRIVLAYNGNYEELKEQLYEALARSSWESQLKESLADQAKGSITIEDIPFWFKEGAIRYFAHQWPIKAEDALKRTYRDQQFQNWEQVIAYQPRLAGQAFCYYLNQKYYPQAVLQIYQQLKKKDLQRSLRLLTKRSMDSVYHGCYAYYHDRLSEEAPILHEADSIAIRRKKGSLLQIAISPDQKHVAYTVSRRNKRTVYLYNKETQRTIKATTYPLPPWLNNHQNDPYPQLHWQDTVSLAVLLPAKGKHQLKQYGPDGSRQRKDVIEGADGILSFQPTGDYRYLFSAYRKGQSDIVSYDANKLQYQPYTADVYDDAHPTKTTGGGKLYYTSTRPDTLKGTKDTIRFRQGIYITDDKIITPVLTDTLPYVRWDKPELLPGNRLLLTTTITGAEQFKLIDNLQQPHRQKQLDNYRPYQYLPGSKDMVFHRADKDSIYINTIPLDTWVEQSENEETKPSPWLKDHDQRKAEEAHIDSMLRAARDEEPSFLEQVLLPGNTKEKAKQKADSISRSLQYDPKKVRPFILQLHSAYFATRINNDYFINRYQPYQNYQGQFKFPEIGGMVQGGFSDLLENYHVNIAFRMPAANEGSDFFVRYENKAKKWDWGIAYFRKVEPLKPDPKRRWVDGQGRLYPNTAKVKTHYYEASATYPFTYELSGSIRSAIRQDRTIFLATERYSLNFEDIDGTWLINTLSLNWNKLDPTLPLLYKGWKTKGLIDVFNGLAGKATTTLGSTIQAEYHQPLYKYITLITQAKAGYSAGQGKVLYNTGQIDNTLTPRIDSNIHFAQNVPYTFQTLITPFRGHLQNSLYGDRFLLLNADVYFPLFQTLIPLETPLQFVNLLQVGFFTDAAMAQESWNNTASNKGWLWSYGWSARTQLAGYPIRFDMAWPGTFSEKSVWYISLSLK